MARTPRTVFCSHSTPSARCGMHLATCAECVWSTGRRSSSAGRRNVSPGRSHSLIRSIAVTAWFKRPSRWPRPPEALTKTRTANMRASTRAGLVKKTGDLLVVLRRGRLFTIDTSGAQLAAIDMADLAKNGDSYDWYDELLITDRTVIVIGYSNSRGGTEVVLFNLERRRLPRTSRHLQSPIRRLLLRRELRIASRRRRIDPLHDPQPARPTKQSRLAAGDAAMGARRERHKLRANRQLGPRLQRERTALSVSDRAHDGDV